MNPSGVDAVTVAQAAEILLEELPGLQADELMAELEQEINETLPGRQNNDALSAFLSSYNNTTAENKTP